MMDMKSELSYPVSKGLVFGLLGGLIGAIVMGGLASMMPVPTQAGGVPFFVAAAMLMGAGSAATAAGWMIHLITGLIIGAIFGAVTSRVAKLRFSSVGRGVALGVVAGIIVWVVFFMPMMASLMPALMSIGFMVAGSFVAHIIYGAVLGGVAGGLLLRTATYVCPACGGTFKSQSELTDHKMKEHQTQQQM